MIKKKIAIVALHPSNYQVGIWKELSKVSSLELTVFYLSDIGVKAVFDPEFGRYRTWNDIPLLEGHNYQFPRNFAKNTVGYGFFSRVNPGVLFLGRDYDVILIHGYDTISMWLAFFSAKFFKKRLLWRGEVTNRQSLNTKSFKFFIKRILLKFMFKTCDSILYSCTGNKKYILNYTDARSKLIEIPCAVDNDYFNSRCRNNTPLSNDTKKNLEICENDFVIIFSARMSDRKRPMDLLQAIESLKMDNVIALFVGDGGNLDKMKSYTKKNKINARFVGYKSQGEISKYYSVANMGVILSDYDPSPKSLNEMMNFSLPVIVTSVTGTSEDLVKHGINGYIVNSGDIKGISKYIKNLAIDRNLARNMGKKSLEIVRGSTFVKDAIAIETASWIDS